MIMVIYLVSSFENFLIPGWVFVERVKCSRRSLLTVSIGNRSNYLWRTGDFQPSREEPCVVQEGDVYIQTTWALRINLHIKYQLTIKDAKLNVSVFIGSKYSTWGRVVSNQYSYTSGKSGVNMASILIFHLTGSDFYGTEATSIGCFTVFQTSELPF